MDDNEKKTVAMTVRVEEELYTKFKMLLIQERSNVQNFLAEAISSYVKSKTNESK